ncbi:hypothetical protein MMC25_007945 [Agyrium rufum]|nr:hypothetical protein [Agyrium rufum]
MPRPRRRSEHGEAYDIASSDVEKHAFDPQDSSYESEDDHPSNSNSSGDSYGSREPILVSSRASARRKASYYHYRLPNRHMRWLCLALMSTIVLFIMSLIRSSWTSARLLESPAVKKPPPPPTWESFEFLERYYGGVRNLISREQNVPEYPRDVDEELSTNASVKETREILTSSPYRPYPDYTSTNYKLNYGPVQECYLREEEKLKVPDVYAFKGVPRGFPDHAMGSYEELGIDNTVCFERFGRYGPYGFGYSRRKGGVGAGLDGDREGVDDVWKESREIDYSKISWKDAQDKCVGKNKHRFEPVKESEEVSSDVIPSIHERRDEAQAVKQRDNAPAMPASNATVPKSKPPADTSKSTKHGPIGPPAAKTAQPKQKGLKYLSRTVVLIRTWFDFEYTDEDILYLRSLISELSLMSGGEYTVHFLVHVKDDNRQIWADQATYNEVLEHALPKEFHGMGSLWSERQMGLIYGGIAESFYRDLPVHGVYRSTFMAVQYFAHRHPEYDFFWNWEMDVRYTGHWYQLFDSLSKWAKQQPRKGLWERNARFYIPSVHGTWDDFKQMVRVQSQMGTESTNNMWAAISSGKGKGEDGKEAGRAKSVIEPPVWGPLAPEDVLKLENEPQPPTSFDKDKYKWGVDEEADFITLNPMFDPDGTTWILAEDVTGYDTDKNGFPPRRTAIITASRLSRRLLDTMHAEVSLGRHTMFSEMWPASAALHHGLKAVYAPHPVFVDRNWPPHYLASVFNGGKNGASGGARTSVFGDREHNFRGTTWYYSAGFSPNFWRRWLGYKVDATGGEEMEMAGEGRMCAPPMLLHPVKNVQLVVEGRKEGEK